jgi:hypothetical protein
MYTAFGIAMMDRLAQVLGIKRYQKTETVLLQFRGRKSYF